VSRDGRPRHHLRAIDQQRHLHRHRAASAYRQGAVYANGEFIQVHPTASQGANKLAHLGKRPRRGGRVWVPKIQATSASRTPFPSEIATTFSNECTRVTEISCLATSRRARFFALASRASRHLQRKDRQERERSLPRPDAQGEAFLRRSSRHPRDLRKVRRSRPVQEPMKVFPRCTIPWAASGSTSNGTERVARRRLSA